MLLVVMVVVVMIEVGVMTFRWANLERAILNIWLRPKVYLLAWAHLISAFHELRVVISTLENILICL